MGLGFFGFFGVEPPPPPPQYHTTTLLVLVKYYYSTSTKTNKSDSDLNPFRALGQTLLKEKSCFSLDSNAMKSELTFKVLAVHPSLIHAKAIGYHQCQGVRRVRVQIVVMVDIVVIVVIVDIVIIVVVIDIVDIADIVVIVVVISVDIVIIVVVIGVESVIIVIVVDIVIVVLRLQRLLQYYILCLHWPGLFVLCYLLLPLEKGILHSK